METKNDAFQKEFPTPFGAIFSGEPCFWEGNVVHIPAGAYEFSSKTPTSPDPSSADETERLNLCFVFLFFVGMYQHEYKGVSKNRGTPKWMVYDGKPY